jgi:hypothetical protein
MPALALPSPGADPRHSWRFLAKIATIPPSAWDAVVPAGRVHPSAVERIGEAVSREVGSARPHEAVVGARLMQGLAGSTVGRGTAGRRVTAAHALVVEVEDWCRAGWPRRWDAPHRWADFDRSMVFAGGALAAANLADRHEPLPTVQDALALAAELLAERTLVE